MKNLYIINKQESQKVRIRESEVIKPFYYIHYEAMKKHKALAGDYLYVEEGDLIVVLESINKETKFNKIVEIGRVFDETISEFEGSEDSRSDYVDKTAKLIDVHVKFRLDRPVSVRNISSRYPSISLFDKNGNLKQGAKCAKIESNLASEMISEITNGEVALDVTSGKVNRVA